MNSNGSEENDAIGGVPGWAFVPLMLVAGLPGSGKTTWSRAVAARTGALLIDDFKSRATDLELVNSPKLAHFSQAIGKGRPCIVVDVDFTRTEARSQLDDWLFSMFPRIGRPLWVFFENNPGQCRVNVLADKTRTNTKARLTELDERAPNYIIPPLARVVPVWKTAVKGSPVRF